MRLKIVIFQRNTFTAHSYVFEWAFFECPGPYFWRPLLTFSLHGWVYMNCLFWTHFRSSLLSLQKIASANPSCKTISVTWNLLFWWWPIRSKDSIRLEWLLATSRAEASWISARVTKYALEREFCDHNKVSCDVECWFLYKATASKALYVTWAFGFAL